MADLEKTVAIVFRGVDDLSGTVSRLSSSVDSFGGKVASATQPLADMTDAVLKVEAALAAMAIGGLALATKTAGEFGDSFAEITTLIDVPAQAIDQFRTDIIQYARDSTHSLDFLRVAEELSVGGRADLESVTRLLKSTMNAYGAETDEARSYSDAFFKTVKIGQTTIPQLADSMAAVASIAAASGVDIDTLGASIAALTGTGIKTEEAMTLIKGAITNIIKPSAQATEEAQKLGIEFDAAALKSEGFDGILRKVWEATGGNADSMAKLFGNIRGYTGAVILGEDASGKFALALDEMENKAGATDEAYQKMADNFALANQKIVNNIRATLIDVGAPLLDEYGDIADGLSSIFEGISVGLSSDAFKPVFDALQNFGSDAAQFLSDVAAAMPEALEQIDFSDFLSSIEGLGDELQGLFNAFFGDIDLTTPEGLSQAMQKVVDSFTALTNITAGILDTFEPFVRILGDLVDKVNDTDEGTQEVIGQFLGWGKVVNEVASNINILSGAMTVIAGALSLMSLTHIPGVIGSLARFTPAIISATSAVAPFAAIIAAPFVGHHIGTWLSENVPIVNEFTDAILKSADSIFNFTGAQDVNLEAARAFEAQTQKVVERVKAMTASIDEVPPVKTTELTVSDIEKIKQDIDDFNQSLQEVSEPVDVEITAHAETAEVERVGNLIIRTFPDQSVEISVAEDAESIDKTKQVIETEIPSEKILEIKLQGEIDVEIARIKAQADTIQTAVEWQARLDIAEVEANAQIIEAAFDSISVTMQSTGDVLSELFGIWGETSGLGQIRLERWIREEMEIRREALRLQKELTDAQVGYLEARTEAIEQGEALIQVTGEGLEIELEAFMWKILEKIQIRATAEGAEFLLGI
jgi:TP901 family phage tail tape measure protein